MPQQKYSLFSHSYCYVKKYNTTKYYNLIYSYNLINNITTLLQYNDNELPSNLNYCNNYYKMFFKNHKLKEFYDNIVITSFFFIPTLF